MSTTTRIEEVDTGDVTLSCAVDGEGPVVIALHGFPDCRDTFLPIVPALVSAGYRVVRPALRGYFPSGVARSGRHDSSAAGDDALRLADHFAPRGAGDSRVRIIGHDWGAVAAFAAAISAPDRVSHLVTMAVPHASALVRNMSAAQVKRFWYMGLFQLPVIAEAMLSRDDLALVDRLWRDWSPQYVPTDQEMDAVKEGIRGRLTPVLQYYRALTSLRRLPDARAMFSEVRVPSIHLLGEEDGCVGAECADGSERFYKTGFAVHRIQGAGHFFMREKPREVARAVIDFLGS